MQEILRHDWVKIWTTKYSLLSLSLFVDEYLKEMKREVGAGYDHILFAYEKGLATLFRIERETNTAARTLALNSLKEGYAEKCVSELDRLKKEMEAIIDNSVFDSKTLQTFLHTHRKLIPYFLVPIWASNELKNTPGDAQKKEYVLSLYEKARKSTETLYPTIEKFLDGVYEKIALKENIEPSVLHALLPQELNTYFKSGTLPSSSVLQNRYEYSLIYADTSGTTDISGAEAKETIRKVLEIKHPVNEIKGTKAYGGYAKGEVRIIFRDEDCATFKDGQILVTTMTRPEWLPIMKKAAAYVTDAGGILCHAAIVAREMKVPCVTNTKIATQVLKNGDKIEVDAEKGIVKII